MASHTIQQYMKKKPMVMILAPTPSSEEELNSDTQAIVGTVPALHRPKSAKARNGFDLRVIDFVRWKRIN